MDFTTIVKKALRHDLDVLIKRSERIDRAIAAVHVLLGTPPVPDAALIGGKNPSAVALGKLGGKKGGLARAQKLSKERRSEIAKIAADARWKKAPA